MLWLGRVLMTRLVVASMTKLSRHGRQPKPRSRADHYPHTSGDGSDFCLQLSESLAKTWEDPSRRNANFLRVDAYVRFCFFVIQLLRRCRPMQEDRNAATQCLYSSHSLFPRHDNGRKSVIDDKHIWKFKWYATVSEICIPINDSKQLSNAEQLSKPRYQQTLDGL
jgi:hypothetical protein